MSAFSTPGSSRPGSSRSGTCTPTTEDAFNHYALYSDFSSLMPGAAPAPPAIRQPPNSKCIPPQLLYSHSAPSTAPSSPMVSRVSSPTPSLSAPHHLSHSHTHSHSHSHPASQIQASTTLSRPASSLLLSKPFRCPTKGCNKSYKQANGLKYHITHGQCNFMPRDPSLEGLNEREADQKSRPYVCQVGSCTRRYKNMNGLRYHHTRCAVSNPHLFPSLYTATARSSPVSILLFTSPPPSPYYLLPSHPHSHFHHLTSS